MTVQDEKMDVEFANAYRFKTLLEINISKTVYLNVKQENQSSIF